MMRMMMMMMMMTHRRRRRDETRQFRLVGGVYWALVTLVRSTAKLVLVSWPVNKAQMEMANVTFAEKCYFADNGRHSKH